MATAERITNVLNFALIPCAAWRAVARLRCGGGLTTVRVEDRHNGNVGIMSKHVVATVAEIPPGQRKLVTIRGRQIAVFNLDGEFFGLFNRCPHQGGPMCEGILTGLIESDEPGDYRYSRKGEILRCPWHGWEFDVRTGQSFCDPSKISVRSYPVEVAEGQRVVQGPYVAETIPVTIEQQYVVVEM
jgi:3-phenylpropionate/trans-cinnamate dioxygenase ferredoxin subunit